MLPQDGAYVVYIYPNGAANLDKRLQLFDKIIEVEGKKITADMSYTDLKKVFKRRYLVVRSTNFCVNLFYHLLHFFLIRVNVFF